MAGANVGSVGVEVYPDASGFWPRFTADTAAGAQAASEQLARTLTARLPQALQDAIAKGLSNPVTSRTQGQRSGAAYADAFATEVKAKLDAAARALGPRVNVDANTEPAVAQMEALRREIRQTEAFIRIGRIDDTQAVAQIDDLHRKLAQLGADTSSVRIKVDTAAASAQLEALRAQLGSLDAEAKVASSSGGGFGALLRVAGLLAPALIPIGAAAVPGVLALGAAGGVAALAFLGLKNNVDEVASAQVRQQITGLKNDLTSLEGVAARASASGVTQGLKDIHSLAPTVSSDVALVGHALGDIFANGVQGASGTLQVFMPLILRTVQGVDSLSKSFAGAGQSQGLQTFFNYVSTEGPQVVAMLASVGTTIGHLVQAAAPFGSIVVTALQLFSSAINAIPMPVLTALVGVFESYLLYRTVAGVFTSIGAAMEGFATRAAATATQTAVAGAGASALTASLGPVGLAAAGVTAVLGIGLAMWQRHNAATAEAKANIAQLTQAMEADGNAIGDQTNKLIAKNIADSGQIQNAQKLGINVDTLTKAWQGNADAQAQVTTAIDGATHSYAANLQQYGLGADAVAKDSKARNDAALSLRDAMDAENAAMQQSTANSAAYTEALAAVSDGSAGANTASALLGATQSYTTVMVNGTTWAMNQGTNAADVYHNALQNLSGNSLDAASAQLSFEGSVQAATKALQDNSGNLDIHTAKGLADQQAIIQMIQAANQHADAVFRQTGNLDAANAALADDEQGMRDAAAAAGDNKDKVNDLINKYAAVPGNVSTVVTANTSSAQAAVDALLGSLQKVEIMGASTGGARTDMYLGPTIPQFKGGIVKSFASGGFNTSLAQIVPDNSNVLFAERGTGGEAYIPMGADHRVRSTQILNTVAGEFGYQLAPQGQMGSDALVAEIRVLQQQVGQLTAVSAAAPSQVGREVGRQVGAGSRRNPAGVS